ncbi:MAG: cupin domain-containing protein [Parcubacteria group bacterium]
MDLGVYKKKADLIRDNDVYRVYDLKTLGNLTLSLTELNPHKSTTGHSHENAEEVYVFISGKGEMEIGETREKVTKGNVFLIPKGDFHRVHNKGWQPLKFWSIFEKYEGRGLK